MTLTSVQSNPALCSRKSSREVLSKLDFSLIFYTCYGVARINCQAFINIVDEVREMFLENRRYEKEV